MLVSSKNKLQSSSHNYGYEWMLAVRYLRSRRDERFIALISWSSAIGVAIGVAALIIVLSVMQGFEHELRDRILGFSSHVDIQGSGDILEDWQGWLEKVEKLPHIIQATPYAVTQVMVVNGSRAAGAILKGVDVNRDHEVAKHMIAGDFSSLTDGSPFKVVLGKDLAHKLGVEIGEQMELISPTAGVSPSGIGARSRRFVVAGIFSSGFYEYDIGMLIVPLKAVQILNRLGSGVSGIELRLDDRNLANSVSLEVAKVLPVDAWVTNWTRRHKSFFQALQMERLVMGIILSLIVLVAVFNMVTSLVMLVMERRREIAILKTVGATDSAILRIFLYMGVILTTIGTVFGGIIGLIVAWKIDSMLAWIESVTHIKFLSGDVYYINHVPSSIEPASIASVLGVSLLMGILATFYPAWRAAKVPPAEALRY
ncbi:MAG: lipoprotein-releasing ABC transporter permease subunit [Mariprofundales bacterium]